MGPDAELFVDANGAYSRKEALAKADAFAEFDVRWFEEPVSSDDLAGLKLMRDRAPAGMDIAAGEYGYDLFYFRRMLESDAVDVLQADATRCGGITGYMQAGVLCREPMPARYPRIAHSTCTRTRVALPACRHIEYFHDHERIERMLLTASRTKGRRIAT